MNDEDQLLRKGCYEFEANNRISWTKVSLSYLKHRTPGACKTRWQKLTFQERNHEASVVKDTRRNDEEDELLNKVEIENEFSRTVKSYLNHRSPDSCARRWKKIKSQHQDGDRDQETYSLDNENYPKPPYI